MKKLSVIASMLLMATSAHAQWTVIDPVSIGHQIKSFVQDHQTLLATLREVDTAVKTYNTEIQHLQTAEAMWGNMQWQMRTVEDIGRYRGATSLWQMLTTPANPYGATGKWIQAANTGVWGGYGTSVIPIGPYQSLGQAGMSPDQQARLEARLASIMLHDGVNQVSLMSLGGTRSLSGNILNALHALGADSQNPTQTTPTQMRQKQLAANVLGLQQSESERQLMAALVESEAVRSKDLRDEQVQALNSSIVLRTGMPLVTVSSTNGAPAELGSWHISQ